MTDEEIDKYFEGLDRGVALLGYRSFEEGAQAFFPWLAGFVQRLAVFQDRNTARHFLRQLPSGEPEAMEEVFKRVPELVYRLRESMPEMVKKLPHPPGGRPSLRTPERDKMILEEVERLTEDKSRKKLFSYKKVALKFGVSTTTVQRICREQKRKQQP